MAPAPWTTCSAISDRGLPVDGCDDDDDDTTPARTAPVPEDRRGGRHGSPGRRRARGEGGSGVPEHRPGVGARRPRPEPANHHRRDRRGPHLPRPRHARHLEASAGPHRVGVRPGRQAPRGSEEPGQRPLHEDEREGLRRRDDVRRLSRTACQSRHRRGGHQHARPLARRHRHRRRAGRQGHLPPEAGLTHDRGRASPE